MSNNNLKKLREIKKRKMFLYYFARGSEFTKLYSSDIGHSDIPIRLIDDLTYLDAFGLSDHESGFFR